MVDADIRFEADRDRLQKRGSRLIKSADGLCVARLLLGTGGYGPYVWCKATHSGRQLVSLECMHELSADELKKLERLTVTLTSTQCFEEGQPWALAYAFV